MSVLHNSIFESDRFIIPMAEVAFIEQNAGGVEICVVLKGSKHPTDPNGNLVSGYGRADCPYLCGAEKDAFLSAWYQYRQSLE